MSQNAGEVLGSCQILLEHSRQWRTWELMGEDQLGSFQDRWSEELLSEIVLIWHHSLICLSWILACSCQADVMFSTLILCRGLSSEWGDQIMQTLASLKVTVNEIHTLQQQLPASIRYNTKNSIVLEEAFGNCIALPMHLSSHRLCSFSLPFMVFTHGCTIAPWWFPDALLQGEDLQEPCWATWWEIDHWAWSGTWLWKEEWCLSWVCIDGARRTAHSSTTVCRALRECITMMLWNKCWHDTWWWVVGVVHIISCYSTNCSDITSCSWKCMQWFALYKYIVRL